MSKITKKRKEVLSKIDRNKLYTLSEASSLVKEINQAKFDASVDLHIRLGVDPRKSDQAIRGTVVLPNGTGKTKRVLALVTPDKEEEAKAAGADFVGLDEYIQKIQGGWLDIDVIIAAPNVMAQVGRIGRVLGPRGLMPNPKSGTVTPNIGAAVTAVKGGKIAFRVDKYGIIHASVGRVSFEPKKIEENADSLIQSVLKLKPSSAKGEYVRSVSMASTMSPGIYINPKSL